MPYTTAPSKIKGLPEHAQKIWLKAFNSAYANVPKGKNADEDSNQIAWGAVKNAGYKQDKDGKWAKEAVASTSQGAILRPQICSKCGREGCTCAKPLAKESFLRPVYTIASLREASVDESKREIKVVIISEGKGNKRDKHYYTREAIKSAPRAFEGAQCYADHPSKTEEMDRPKRSVKEIIGYFTGCEIQEMNGLMSLVATLKIVDGDSYQWAWDLAKESVNYAQKYPTEDLVGISINADGKTRKAQINGEDWNFVDAITDVFSADVVTKPARGGKSWR